MNRHLTEDEISRAVVGQSTFEEQQHANGCPECRGEIARSLQILALVRQGLRSYAEYELRRSTMTVRRPSVTGRLITTVAVATAAVVAFVAAMAWQNRSTPPADAGVRPIARQLVASGHSGSADVAINVMNDFYPLKYSGVPVSEGRIIRIEVPRSAPIAFGLDPVEFVSARRGAILADVIVGEDGLARAVRFVRPATGAVKE